MFSERIHQYTFRFEVTNTDLEKLDFCLAVEHNNTSGLRTAGNALSLGFCSVVLIHCLFGNMDLLVFILIHLMDSHGW